MKKCKHCGKELDEIGVISKHLVVNKVGLDDNGDLDYLKFEDLGETNDNKDTYACSYCYEDLEKADLPSKLQEVI